MNGRAVVFAHSFKALLSHYWRHPWQTVFLLAGLVAGVGLWSAVQVINSHARASYAEADSLLGAQTSDWIRSRSGAGIVPADYIALRRQGFRQVFPLVQARVSTPDNTPLSVIATDLLALPGGVTGESGGRGPGSDSALGSPELDWLAFIQPPYQAWFPAEVARELGLAAGDRLRLRDGRKLPPALIASRAQQGRQILMDIGAAFALLSREHLTALAVGPMSAAKRARLEAALPSDLRLEPNHQRLDLTQLTASLHTQLTAMSLLSFAVGLFIVFNAVRFSLWFRRPTLRNLRLMGVSVRALAVAIVAETLLWSVLGCALGLLTGYGISHLLLPSVSASLQNLYGAVVGARLLLQPQTVLIAWLMTLAGLALALAWPLLLQLRRPVLAAGSVSADWSHDRRARRQLAIGGTVLALTAAGVFAVMGTVIEGFVLLGLVLFAAAWWLPQLLAFAHGGLSRALADSALLRRWIVSDGWAQLPALRTAMMALLLALTANLGVETLIGSFRTALGGWLDQRIGADLYVQSERIDPVAFAADAANTPWLADSHARIGVNLRWQGRPTRVLGIDPQAPDTRVLPLADAEPQALALWGASNIAEPRPILANEQAHYLGGLQLGDPVTLSADAGEVHYTVVGFFHDYGNAQFQFYLPYAEVARRWQDARPQGLALWLVPGADEAAAEGALLAAGARPGEWLAQGDIKRLSLKIFDRTFAMTAAMNTLTLLVAAIALLTALLAILHERLPEFAQWRALGVMRREHLLVIAVPLGMFAAITWLLSIPLGALLSWLLIHKLNVMSFGWSMPMLWSPVPALKLGALVFMIIALVLALVSLQLRRRLPQAMAELGSGV